MNELNFRIGNFTISFSEQALAAHDHRHAKPLLEQAETLVARFRAFLTVRHASPVDADWWKTYYRFLNRYASHCEDGELSQGEEIYSPITGWHGQVERDVTIHTGWVFPKTTHSPTRKRHIAEADSKPLVGPRV